ncbi:MAG: hypothetical protein CM15mP58_18630 [Burkholderiaceae bacterium]|nr:MAG: hypothetical protein CM15mP58_18630 [Burkholderiaceae bacterium]
MFYFLKTTLSKAIDQKIWVFISIGLLYNLKLTYKISNSKIYFKFFLVLMHSEMHLGFSKPMGVDQVDSFEERDLIKEISKLWL